MVKWFQTSQKKPNFLISFLHHNVHRYQTSTLPPLTFRTDKQLSSLKVDEDDILSIIKGLNSNKSHGLDKLSIKMTKMCHKILVYNSKLISKASIQGVFPDCWKKANVVPIHKKEVKIF